MYLKITQCILCGFLFGQLTAEWTERRKSLSHSANKVLRFHLSGDHSKRFVRRSTLLDHRSEATNDLARMSSPLCFPYDSCISRCGKSVQRFPFTCNCDPKCVLYFDCCVDYEQECLNDTTITTRANVTHHSPLPRPTCNLLYEDFAMLMVSSCSESWTDVLLIERCKEVAPIDCVLSNIMTSNDANDAFVSCWNFVYSECSDNFGLKCDPKLENSCEIVKKNHCSETASNRCQNCSDTRFPVIDSDGMIYRNVFCALCNYQRNYTKIDLRSLVKELNYDDHDMDSNKEWVVRNCIPSAIDLCPLAENNAISDHCKNTSGYVIPFSGYHAHNRIYKNIYCAICNNEDYYDLACAFMPANDSGTPKVLNSMMKPMIIDFISGVSSDIQGLGLDDIPAAFSMLLNFGLDGRQRIYISPEDADMQKHQRKCGSGFIWDQFSEICRKIHCSTDFLLIDYQCVKKNPEEVEILNESDMVPIPETAADSVHLVFNAEMGLFDFLTFYQQDIESICESIRESFSNSFNIEIDRIRNVSFNISLGQFDSFEETLAFLQIMDEDHAINFTISMDLYETPDVNASETARSLDSIVSMMASALKLNGFDLGISNSTSRIYEIHQTIEYIDSWCNPKEGGQTKEYWNSEFRLVINNETSPNSTDKIDGIYVHTTNKFYPKGQFLADILYQGYQFNTNLINVSGVAIVCDYKIALNQSCLRVILEKDEYVITENGSLEVMNSCSKLRIDESAYENLENGSILVCLSMPLSMPLSLNAIKCHNQYLEMYVVQAYVSYILTWISISALIVVLITYFLFSKLRNLPGCNTMNLTFSLLAMQITFIFGQRPTVIGLACKVVAQLTHYEILCCFMWMNIMAYDLYKTFGTKTILNNIRTKDKYLLRYMAYGYGVPVLVITTTFLLDYFLEDSEFSPHYGEGNACWISSKYAAVLYFAIPLAIVMIINMVFLILTIYSIKSVKHVLYLSNQKNCHTGKSDALLFARMALVIGLTWALAFAAAYVREEKLTGLILTYLFTVFNTLQGVFIFGVFVCNRRVYELYRESCGKILKLLFANSVPVKNPGNLARMNDAMRRTVSSNTVVSTISNASTWSKESGLETIQETE